MSEKVIQVLCNSVRLKIVSCLNNKQKTVNELIKTCSLSQSAVSQHLAKLRKAGIIQGQKDGRQIRYFVTDQDFVKISNKLLEYIKEDK